MHTYIIVNYLLHYNNNYIILNISNYESISPTKFTECDIHCCASYVYI